MDSRYNQNIAHQEQQQQHQHQKPQQQYHQQQQASYGQYSPNGAMSTSTFASSTSLSSLTSMSTSPTQTNMQSPILSSAPLPSPNMTRQQPASAWFGGLPPVAECQQQSQFSDFAPQRRTSFCQNGKAPDTAQYLQDFSLLAEAAKRAQMACLMRDLDDLEM